MVGLVFTETGTLYQHAAIVMVCAAQLVVQARAQPYNTATENALQYLGTFLTFAMSFGGMLMQSLNVSMGEAGHRLFGVAKLEMEKEYQGSIRSVQTSLDLILVLVILSAVALLGYEQWKKRQERKATLSELSNKTRRFHRQVSSVTKRSCVKLAASCGCCGDWARNHLAAMHAKDRDTEMTERHRAVSRDAVVATDDARGCGAGDFESVRERVSRMGSGDFDFEGPINPMVTYATEIEEKHEEKNSGSPDTTAPATAASFGRLEPRLSNALETRLSRLDRLKRTDSVNV
jgi:hypothetical protein